MSASPKSVRARIPSVDEVLRSPECAALLAEFGHVAVRDKIRTALEDVRKSKPAHTSIKALANGVGTALEQENAPSLRPVFNLTGTILHTNLGRAPLPKTAIEAMVAASGAVNLEYDLAVGQRGQRDSHIEGWVKRLTGAEAAVVVNNNAAAVLIALNTFARDKDVVISRGELIEIGGSFRIPEIMESAGCRLREVGTTNRTHQKDFKGAISPKTGAILKVHTSNYRIDGFTKAVPEEELGALARANDIPFMVDLGSGTLIDLTRFGLPYERTVRETLENGADLVTFSGDKLLGGPQSGIIAGRADLIARIAANPMKRALRLDKVTLAVLAAVFRLYANPETLADHLPALRLLRRPAEDILAQANRLLPHLQAALDGLAHVEIEACRSQIGSGAMPVDLLESHGLCLSPIDQTDQALRDLATRFRAAPRPVIGRISNGKLVLDLRALEDEIDFIEQLKHFTLNT